MTHPFAMLPMYDWPEARANVDHFWAAVRTALQAEGIDAPSELSRPHDLHAAWADDALLIGQTCGLPLVHDLAEVAVIGAFDNQLEDTPPGWYHSALVVDASNPATDVEALRGATVAVNSAESQSGHAVWRHELGRRGLTGTFFGDVIVSGGHRQSIQAVAEGRADVAAIDAVSLRLATRHEPATDSVRVLSRSLPTPGLPLITAPANVDAIPAMQRALSAAVGSLSAAEREALHIHAFVPLERVDYDLISERWAAAAEVPALA